MLENTGMEVDGLTTKVSIVGGSGMVGSTLAQRLVPMGVSDIVLVDIRGSLAQGRALDILHGMAVRGDGARIEATTNLSAVANSDVVVITAGRQRTADMKREGLAAINASIITDIAKAVSTHAPLAKVILFTNPLDLMTRWFLDQSGLCPNAVIGQAGVLDSARLQSMIAAYAGVAVTDVSGMMMGNHSDQMFAITDSIRIGGLPVSLFVPPSVLQELIDRARNGGAEVNRLMEGQGSFAAAGEAGAVMVRAILQDEHRVMTACVSVDGPYGLSGVCLGVPAVIGKAGVERILEVPLRKEERTLLNIAARTVTEQYEALRKG